MDSTTTPDARLPQLAMSAKVRTETILRVRTSTAARPNAVATTTNRMDFPA
jgi:hypothetical protein